MKTLLRLLLFLALIVWLGSEVFLPIAAAVTFNTLAPNTHMAGMIVGQLIRILHGMGLVSGMVAMAVLALGPAFKVYAPKMALGAMALLVLMIGLTVVSQYGIIPAMEQDRVAAGGAIDLSDKSNPLARHFDKLHHWSEDVEGAILLMGLGVVSLVALAEGQKG